jgi:hypothetical protein
MGATNAHPAFVAMVMQMEDEWTQQYREKRRKVDEPQSLNLIRQIQKAMDGRPDDITNTTDRNENWDPRTDPQPPWAEDKAPDPTSAVIVDDIIIAAANAPLLLFYFTCVLSVLHFYRVTVKLRKTRFFPKRAEFVGSDVLPTGNSPAESKNEAISELERPCLFTDLRMLIGLIGFY